MLPSHLDSWPGKAKPHMASLGVGTCSRGLMGAPRLWSERATHQMGTGVPREKPRPGERSAEPALSRCWRWSYGAGGEVPRSAPPLPVSQSSMMR